MALPFAPVAVPPLAQQKGEAYVRLVELMQRLLAPDGCPWDREQIRERCVATSSKRPARSSTPSTRAIAPRCARSSAICCSRSSSWRSSCVRRGRSVPTTSSRAIVDKLVRRHPHVFADVDVSGSGEVLQNWERIKAAGEEGSRLCSEAFPAACPRSPAPSASARRSSAWASTGPTREARARRWPRSSASSIARFSKVTRRAIEDGDG